MNNLTSFYKLIKDFADNHNMVNEFLLVGSDKDLSSREFNYRTIIIIPSNSNVSRDLARPLYTLSFDCAILDRINIDDDMSLIKSVEENIFVVGQLQDYLIQNSADCYIDEVDVDTIYEDDNNITTAYFNITVSFARKNYNVGIDNQ